MSVEDEVRLLPGMETIRSKAEAATDQASASVVWTEMGQLIESLRGEVGRGIEPIRKAIYDLWKRKLASSDPVCRRTLAYCEPFIRTMQQYERTNLARRIAFANDVEAIIQTGQPTLEQIIDAWHKYQGQNK